MTQTLDSETPNLVRRGTQTLRNSGISQTEIDRFVAIASYFARSLKPVRLAGVEVWEVVRPAAVPIRQALGKVARLAPVGLFNNLYTYPPRPAPPRWDVTCIAPLGTHRSAPPPLPWTRPLCSSPLVLSTVPGQRI